MERRDDSRHLRAAAIRNLVRNAGSACIGEVGIESSAREDHRRGGRAAFGFRARLRAGAQSRGGEAAAHAVTKRKISIMPIFEYICKGCDQRFEKLVQGSSTIECPACSS